MLTGIVSFGQQLVPVPMWYERHGWKPCSARRVRQHLDVPSKLYSARTQGYQRLCQEPWTGNPQERHSVNRVGSSFRWPSYWIRVWVTTSRLNDSRVSLVSRGIQKRLTTSVYIVRMWKIKRCTSYFGRCFFTLQPKVSPTKGQTQVAAALKGSFGVYGPILRWAKS